MGRTSGHGRGILPSMPNPGDIHSRPPIAPPPAETLSRRTLPRGGIGEGCDKVTIRLCSSVCVRPRVKSLGIRAEPELPVETRDPRQPEYTQRAAAVERDLSTAPLPTADGDQPL